MILESIIKCLLVITQLSEFAHHQPLCFLVEDKDEFVNENWQLLTDLPINMAKLTTCKE